MLPKLKMSKNEKLKHLLTIKNSFEKAAEHLEELEQTQPIIDLQNQLKPMQQKIHTMVMESI